MSDQRVIDAYLGAHHDTDLSEAEETILAEAERAIAREEKTDGDVMASDGTPDERTDR
jgi:branched-chain amino acid transport system ATP-binding protein